MTATSLTTRSWSWRQTPRLCARVLPTDEPRSAAGRRRWLPLITRALFPEVGAMSAARAEPFAEGIGVSRIGEAR